MGCWREIETMERLREIEEKEPIGFGESRSRRNQDYLLV